MHPYETISLSTTGWILGLLIVLSHLWMLLKTEDAIGFLQKFPRNTKLGMVLMGTGLFWFWLIIVPENVFKSAIAMDLGEFNSAKRILFIAVPIVGYLVIDRVRDFLAVRGFGVIALMAAAPLLASAWMEPATGKILIPIYAYALLTKGLFCVGMPYLTRDAITWATATNSRFKTLATAGLLYGAAILTCTILWW